MADSRRTGYAGMISGLMVRSFDLRLPVPKVTPGQLWEDNNFDLHVAIPDPKIAQGLEWKRPMEISDHPQLFTDGTTRFDIRQGQAGTCWFLAMVASIAKDDARLKEVILDDAYPIGSWAYRGMFHARFWRFGQWEDVYVDDRLPVYKGTSNLWGARSALDSHEFWVPLLEKALAKCHGSYEAVDGGRPGDAYIAMTGGVAETLDYDESDVNRSQKTFNRIRNALQSGALVTTEVPKQFNKTLGLVGQHAYSVTETAVVKGKSLMRILNPWGDTEWTGPWSDKSREWEDVSIGEVPRAVKDEGEFWICLDDFMRYFRKPTVCSLTPDFDQDGVPDSLKYVTNIYGEWRGETAAGFKNKLENPRFKFTVPKSGSAKVPVVVQFIKKREHRKATNFSTRCDVFKVLDQTDRNATVRILGEETNMYSYANQTTSRHELSAGAYFIIPSTREPGQEKSFLIRVFSSILLGNVSEFPSDQALITSATTTVTSGVQNFSLDFTETVNGAWKAGVNAGGQNRYRDTHATNPQLVISVSQRTAVEFLLVRENDGDIVNLGLRLFPTGNAPMGIDEIYSLEKEKDTDGKEYTFISDAQQINATYMLEPGEHTLLVHTDKPDVEKQFAVVVRSSSPVKLRPYQTGL
ncbi:calpain-5-like isoform X2 [Littorina saxatilis]|uniref:Calpain catalytic domain-containing protein n=1 Tax=Littorina saxatilis TaxID=31220 RepID=A0AAN9G9W6_9CAEN